MKISCPSCSAKYSIADEKVQNRLAKIRCRKCGTSIVIDGNVSPANVYAADGGAAVGGGAEAPAAAPAPVAGAGATYSVDLGENDQRQMTVPEIVSAYNSGTVTADTFVWTDGFADWTALAQVEELVAALHAAAQAGAGSPADELSATGASTAPEENPWDSSSANQGPPAAAPGSSDLFGSVASAGSEDLGPSAVPQPTPSPFGGGGAGLGSPGIGSPAATGARNESSVLFSLSALTSGATQSRPSVPAQSSPGGSDDSGLIDLKALTAAAEATQHAPAAAAPIQSPLMSPSPLGGAPMGGGPGTLGGFGTGPSIPPQAARGNNTGIIIGGFLFAGIVAAAVIFSMSSGDEPEVEPPTPATATAPAPTPQAPAEPIPTAKTEELPTAEAKPPSTGTEQEEAAPKTTSPSPRPKSGPRPKSSPSPSPAPAAAPAPKPAASVGKCGCKKDDLMCLMNCAQ